MKLLFKYASRGRPTWFKSTLEKYYSLLSGRHDCQFVVSMDNDDVLMNNDIMRRYLDSKPNLQFFYGDNKNKIQAINADMQGRDFDILVVISDDMLPVMQEYDDVICNDMLRYFPALDGCIHYDDAAHAGYQLIVLTIMGKALYDRFGFIYYPEYKSMWCDNEFTDIVRAENKVVWIDKVVIKHEFMKNGMDEVYSKNNIFWDEDKALYNRRKAKGFPNDICNVVLNK